MPPKPYIQLMRNKDVEFLLANHMNAFRLLTFIAIRARRNSGTCRFTKLDQNQARIGDFKNMGMSEQNYRTAKAQLEKFCLVTCKATRSGTIATLLDSSIYNINPSEGNGQPNGQGNDAPTDNLTDAPRTGNDGVTTKKKGNNVNNAQEVEEDYPHLLALLEGDSTIENALAAIRACHPDFSAVSDMHLQNSLNGQPDRTVWAGAIEGLAARYAGSDLDRPNQTLRNWLGGKPTEKSAPDLDDLKGRAGKKSVRDWKVPVD